MRKLWRLISIFCIMFRYGLDDIAISYLFSSRTATIYRCLFFWRGFSRPAAERLRCALETLGPIFIKLGQVLSTRRDLLPTDFADELAKLQDQVAPFDADLAEKQIKKSLGKPPAELFASFDREPVASASIAQVHFAVLKDGRKAAVKILRLDVPRRIDRDIELMYAFAALGEKYWEDGRRLRLTEVVREFDLSLHNEIDLLCEAANYSQLRRNFADSDKLVIPEIYWEYCTGEIIVMERMEGIPVSHIDELEKAGFDIKQLSYNGVDIFFTQVFEHTFFHADMHPGNILISTMPESWGKYIALDLGIVGSLDDFDREYLSKNFIAFFRRDYRLVAQMHIESGWAPPETRVVDLEAAIRTCCEPVFDLPLKDFSFGQVLLRLFQTSRRFNISIQPQLVLLQKTMLNIEGLGRQLNPDLDLWSTVKPFLERWMKRQPSLKNLLAHLKMESVTYSRILPRLPSLLQQSLENSARNSQQHRQTELLEELVSQQNKRRNNVRRVIWFAAGIGAGLALAYLPHPPWVLFLNFLLKLGIL